MGYELVPPGLKAHQKDQLLHLLAHYMDPELRRKIMHELPLAYNAWMGATIMHVRQPPSRGSRLRLVKVATDFTCTEADQPLDGIVFPMLSGRAEPFEVNDVVEVTHVNVFPDGGWKVLGRIGHRMAWLADWQFREGE